MRKTLIYFLSGMLFLGVSCSKEGTPVKDEEPQDETQDVQFVLSADLPEDQNVVKTGLSGTSAVWKTGDKVSINGTISNAITSGDNGKRGAEFTFNTTPSSPYNVLYPGTSSTNTVTFPASQSYIADSFDNGAVPSYAVASVSGNRATAKMTPLAAVLRFALNGTSTITKIEVNSLGSDKKISGNFTVNFSTGAVTASGSNGTSINYNIGTKTLNTSGDTYFYVAIPNGSYPDGLEALVYEQTTEKYMRLSFGKGKTYGPGDLVEFVSKTYAAGRVEELVTITDFTAQAGGDPEKRAEITVATYNIFSNAEGTRIGRLDLSNCAVTLGKCLHSTGADLISINEIDDTFATSSTQSIQKLAEAQGLTGYTWNIQNPNKVIEDSWFLSNYHTEYYYSNGYAYNPSVLSYVDGGMYWYNANGGYTSSMSSAYSSNLPKYRTILWAKFRHIASNKTFNVIVTHLPVSNDGVSGGEYAEGGAHNYAATSVNAFMQSKDSTGPWLLLGDMNAFGSTSTKTDPNNTGYTLLKTKWTDAYDDMVSQGILSDFYQKYVGTQSGSAQNYYYDVLTFTKNHPDRRLDHIMYRGGFKAEEYKTIRLTYDYNDEPSCPSDHLPVVAKLILN